MKGSSPARRWPIQGWIGVGLGVLFWALNWGVRGPRTHWGFFPMWVGYCLIVDALVFVRRGTSLLTRSWRMYLGLFAVSAPAWWIFEALNYRLQNWQYQGAGLFTPLQFWFWSTLSFSTVIPAVFGSAELAATFPFIQRLNGGPVIRPERATTLGFFTAGWAMLALMMAWPRLFFPFAWVSVFFILEPINIWLGHRNLAQWTGRGDWRPVLALWLGVLITAFFWEMLNYYSFPKWVYHVPGVQFWHIFEMPLLGYGGYLPFALELFAMYHLVAGVLRDRDTRFVYVGNNDPENFSTGELNP